MVEHLGQKGMSLLELMIAMAITAIFGVVLLSGIGGNVFRSEEMRDELKIAELLELKMNELVLEPPPFQENLLTEFEDEQKFEDFPGYVYSVRIHPFMLSDYLAALGQGPDSEEYQEQGELYRRVFNLVAKNVQKIIWQVEITVTHISSERSLSASRFFYNRDASIEWEGGF